MSLHTDIEIYKTAEELFGLVLGAQKNMPREFRTPIGQRLALECTEMMVLIARANRAHGAARIQPLETLGERIEVITILLRVGSRVRAITAPTWAATIELSTSLGKQCAGWLKNTRQAHGQPGTPTPAA